MGLGPSRPRTFAFIVVLLAGWFVQVDSPAWWLQALVVVLAIASLFLLTPLPDTPYMVNVVSVVAGRPVSLTAGARAMVRLPPEFDARRYVAHFYLVVVVLQVALKASQLLSGP